jgi:CheY-like chemotaxis protein
MAHVLVIASDERTIEAYAPAVHSEGYHVVSTTCASLGIALGASEHFDAIVVDTNVRDGSAADFVRQLRALGIHSPVVVMTPPDCLHSAAQAIRCGASDLVRSPVVQGELIAALHLACSTPDAVHARQICTATESHAVQRWARIVVLGAQCVSDPKTLHEWARDIGVSYGALRNWCRTANLSSRNSLGFTRLLRATILHERTGRRFEDLLDVVDLRTLRKLLCRAAIVSEASRTGNIVAAIDEFLGRQSFITDRDALSHVRALLLHVAEVCVPPEAPARAGRIRPGLFGVRQP